MKAERLFQILGLVDEIEEIAVGVDGKCTLGTAEYIIICLSTLQNADSFH